MFQHDLREAGEMVLESWRVWLCKSDRRSSNDAQVLDTLSIVTATNITLGLIIHVPPYAILGLVAISKNAIYTL